MERNEAIEVIKRNYPHVTESGSQFETALRLLIPELAESEDDRIRGAIIDHLKDNNLTEWAAWLEKQGKANMGISEATKQKLEDNLNKALEKETPESWNEFFDEQGEQKQVIDHPDSFPKDNWELVHEFVSKFGRVPKDEDELNVLIEYVLKRQKSAWSEEDESNRTSALMLLRYPITIWNEVNNNTRIKAIDWLKTLKDKYVPQLKQDWSEEDESRRKKIIHILSLDGRIKNEELSDINNWLKSLRPQNTWKPSDEQMDALRYVTNFDYGGHKATLVSLYEQLKKLREK